MQQANLVTLLSADECEEIISKYNQDNSTELKLKSYEIVPAIEVKGFLGEYFHLHIKCYQTAGDLQENDAIVLKFFVKHLPPVDEANEKVTIFRKESGLYDSLIKELQKYSTTPWSPKVYLCHKNILVLEDLDSLGYNSLSSKDSLTENEMFPILKGLASMHAASLLYEMENKTNIETDFNEHLKEISVHPDIPWFITGLKAILEVAKHHSKYQTEVSQKFIREDLQRHLSKVHFMVKPSLKYRNVICHRDTWGGNIFVDPHDNAKSAIFVDFQTCRYSPPAIDIIFTLFMNLTKDERLAKQKDFLQFYYEHLQRNVKMFITSDRPVEEILFSEAEFMESIDEFQLFGLVYRALAATILKVPKEMVTDSYKNENRSEKLLAYMQENEEFRMLMEEIIEDIIEAVFVKGKY